MGNCSDGNTGNLFRIVDDTREIKSGNSSKYKVDNILAADEILQGGSCTTRREAQMNSTKY